MYFPLTFHRLHLDPRFVEGFQVSSERDEGRVEKLRGAEGQEDTKGSATTRRRRC
jgi:hypothetical protein